MNQHFDIRDGAADDWAALERLYPAAFPDEDLLPLLRALLEDPCGVLSLAAVSGNAVAGHVVFTPCGIDDGNGGTVRAALLGPLAVAPDYQRRGVGGALVRAGLARLETDGFSQVFVLGDPAYYGRFGFVPRAPVATPCPIPEEWAAAWQVLALGDAEPVPAGSLSVPLPWRRPELWAP